MALSKDFIVRRGIVVNANTTVPASDNLITTNIVRTPAAPSLDLNFTRSNILDPRVSFSRASGATCIGPNGIMLNVGNNTPRFDYDIATGQNKGLLMEESRTNLISISANPTSAQLNAATSNTFVISYDIPPLNSAATVFKSTRNTSQSDNNVGYLGDAPVLSTSSVSVVSIWVYVPAATTITTINLSFEGLSYSPLNAFDTTKRDQWQRISSTCTSNTTTGVLSCLRPTGMVTGGYFYSTCWQTEAGSWPTSYIPTNSTTVTRAADAASISGTAFNNFYNQTQGSLYIESWMPGSRSATSSFSTALYNSANNYIGMQYVNSVGLYVGVVYVVTNGVSSATSGNASNQSFNAFHKEVVSFNSSSIITYHDGQQITHGTYVAPPQVTQLSIGSRNGLGTDFTFNGSIRRITYWSQQMSNTQLQQLTS